MSSNGMIIITTNLWKITCLIAFGWGGIAFAIGTVLFFPGVTNYWVGGWLFIFGSAGFAVSDGMELITTVSTPSHIHKTIMSKEHCLSRHDWKILNCVLSLIGSILFLVGSVFFLPIFDSTIGVILFIIGTVLCCISQSWKVHRTNRDSSNNVTDEVKLSVLMDTLNGIGSAAYCIGSILFLPWINTSDLITFLACGCFEIGSVIFIISAGLLCISFFFSSSSTSSNDNDNGNQVSERSPQNKALWEDTLTEDRSNSRMVEATNDDIKPSLQI